MGFVRDEEDMKANLSAVRASRPPPATPLSVNPQVQNVSRGLAVATLGEGPTKLFAGPGRGYTWGRPHCQDASLPP